MSDPQSQSRPSGPDAGASEFVDPSPPSPRRLSRRNVLGIGFTILGLLLMLFVSSRRSPAPARDVSVRSEPGYAGRAPFAFGAGDTAQAPVQQPAPSPWATQPSYAPPQQAPREPAVDPRRQLFEQARRSGTVLNVAGSVSGGGAEASGTGDAGSASSGDRSGGTAQPIPLDRGVGGPSVNSEGGTVQLVELSDFTVAEASVIEAALVTAIDSDRPGPVIAQVTRPVYDSKNMQHLLIPAGTRLIGRLEQALEGQDRRVVLAWTRMIFPDGRSLMLPGFPAIETSGEGGLKDKVNLHMASLFGRAALIALLGGGTTYAASQAGGGDTFGPGTILGAQMGLELSRVATAMLQHGLRRRPTVKIRPGYRFLVYVAHDLVFEQPYVEAPSPPRFLAPRAY